MDFGILGEAGIHCLWIQKKVCAVRDSQRTYLLYLWSTASVCDHIIVGYACGLALSFSGPRSARLRGTNLSRPNFTLAAFSSSLTESTPDFGV